VKWALFAVFALTYVGISARRMQWLPIGRPAMAMVGACAMVLVGAFAGPLGLGADEALRAVEPHTIAMLFGMMLIAAGLDEAGFFRWLTDKISAGIRSPAALLWGVTLASGLLSALLVNDAVCLLATPVVLAAARRMGAPRRPFVFALCMGSNAGSALTLSGNPQNMLVAKLSGLSYRGYLARAALPSLAALLMTAAIVHWMHRASLTTQRDAPEHEAGERESAEVGEAVLAPRSERSDAVLRAVAILALVGVVAANIAGASIAWSALVGASVVLLAARKRAEALLARVDWSVLLFFAALFIVVAGLRKTALPSQWLAPLAAMAAGGGGLWLLASVLMVGSQIVSNVPLILLLEPWIRGFADAPSAWTVTALVSTLAGNLTLLGSVANIIVIEQSRETVGFWDYLRVGLPVTALSTAAALTLYLW
jgi:Na+/H+ antiporter NhaD/arsenite permease-like protein